MCISGVSVAQVWSEHVCVCWRTTNPRCAYLCVLLAGRPGLGIAHGPLCKPGHCAYISLFIDFCILTITEGMCMCTFCTHLPVLRLWLLRWLYFDLLWCG
jgi:hypothetical protein